MLRVFNRSICVRMVKAVVVSALGLLWQAPLITACSCLPGLRYCDITTSTDILVAGTILDRWVTVIWETICRVHAMRSACSPPALPKLYNLPRYVHPSAAVFRSWSCYGKSPRTTPLKHTGTSPNYTVPLVASLNSAKGLTTGSKRDLAVHPCSVRCRTDSIVRRKRRRSTAKDSETFHVSCFFERRDPSAQVRCKIVEVPRMKRLAPRRLHRSRAVLM